MKPHLDSRSNFNRYQHSLATVTVDRSFVKNGKSQDARAVVLGEGRMGKKTCKVLVKPLGGEKAQLAEPRSGLQAHRPQQSPWCSPERLTCAHNARVRLRMADSLAPTAGAKSTLTTQRSLLSSVQKDSI